MHNTSLQILVALASLNELVASDAVVDISSMSKDKYRLQERQIPTQLGDREVLTNRNGHAIDNELLRLGRLQSALTAVDAVADSSSLVRAVTKGKHQFEEQHVSMQPGSRTAAAIVAADGEVDRQAFGDHAGHAGEIDLLRSGRSQNPLLALDTRLDSSGLVLIAPEDKQQFEERRNPMQTDSLVAVATVTADGKVDREAIVNRNSHAWEIDLLRSGRSQKPLSASDTRLDSSGLVLTFPKGKQQFEERQNPMQTDSFVAVATVTADSKVDREAIVNRNGRAGEIDLLRSGRSQNPFSVLDTFLRNSSVWFPDVRDVSHIPFETVCLWACMCMCVCLSLSFLCQAV
jgi:hypothetical protein